MKSQQTIPPITTTTIPFYGPASRTTQVSRHQKIRKIIFINFIVHLLKYILWLMQILPLFIISDINFLTLQLMTMECCVNPHYTDLNNVFTCCRKVKCNKFFFHSVLKSGSLVLVVLTFTADNQQHQ